MREKIMALENYIKTEIEEEYVTGPEDYVTRHHFAPGSYAREIELPQGGVVVGKIHRHAHVNVISKGRVRVATPDGVEEISAPATFISTPGTKRVVVALEDTVWTTVHVTEETELDKIETELIAQSFLELEPPLRAQLEIL